MADMMRRKKAELERDQNGEPHITPKFLRQLCHEHELYETPELNTKLYLHYRGIRKIECLEKYTNLKAVWLECNGIRRIEGFHKNTEMLTLFLQQNSIEKIQNLSSMTKLVTLNLSHNRIRVVENLGCLPALKNLDLSSNCFTDHQDLAGLLESKSLASLDLSKNYIDPHEGVIQFFLQLTWLVCFYFSGNPAIRAIKQYRKKMIAGIPSLMYLDDRPVKEVDRDAAQAWMRGGFEEEKKVRKAYYDEQRRKERNYINYATEMAEEYKRKKKMALDRIEKAAKLKKEQLLVKHQELKQKLLQQEEGDHSEQDRFRTIYKIRKVQRELEENGKLLEEQLNQVVVPLQISPNRCTIRRVGEERKWHSGIEARGAAPDLRSGSNSPSPSASVPSLVGSDSQHGSIQSRIPKLSPPRAQLSDEEAKQLEKGEGFVASRAAVPSSDSQDEMAVKFSSNLKESFQGPDIKRVDASGSDSECEGRGAVRVMRGGEMLRWKEKYEEKLEQLLVKWEFDFQEVAKEFKAFLRKEQPGKHYEINARILQVKWTDIEIKKYRMKELRKQEQEDESPEEQEEEQELEEQRASAAITCTNLEELD